MSKYQRDFSMKTIGLIKTETDHGSLSLLNNLPDSCSNMLRGPSALKITRPYAARRNNGRADLLRTHYERDPLRRGYKNH